MNSVIEDKIVIRRADKADASKVLMLIQALADFEKLPGPDVNAKARFLHDGWGSDSPRFEAYIAEVEGLPVGYSIVFYTYSTFLAKPSLYIEDLFILPERRSRGVGQQLFNFLKAHAEKTGCGRLEWVVLDWNTEAQRFYLKHGGEHQTEWQSYRITF